MSKSFNKDKLFKKVQKILKEADGYLGMHGGSVRLKKIDKDQVAYLEFNGACVGCSAADTTLNFFLKESILMQVPEIVDVEAINTQEPDHAPPGIRL